jgi:hypothetical protein
MNYPLFFAYFYMVLFSVVLLSVVGPERFEKDQRTSLLQWSTVYTLKKFSKSAKDVHAASGTNAI